MGFFSQIKEKFVGKSAKQNEKYVAGLDRSNSTFQIESMNLQLALEKSMMSILKNWKIF